jgi:hypothetical protein
MEDSYEYEENLFYSAIQNTTNRAVKERKHFIIREEWNTHSGKDFRRGHQRMRRHREERTLENGRRMLEFCIL